MSVARGIQANRRIARDGVTDDAVNQAKERIGAVFAAYPGIVVGEAECASPADGADELVVTPVFDPGDLGRAAALAVDFIMSRMGVSATAGSDATSYRCSAEQFVHFQRSLAYASELQVNRRPVAELRQTPLPTLLGRAFGAFTRGYDQARGEDRSIAQIGTWANALRVIDPEGTDQRQLVRRAVISKRVAEVVVSRLEKRGRLAVETQKVPGKRGKTRVVHLTADGLAARTSAAALVDQIQNDCRQRFGNDCIDRLRDALASVVARLPVELPHYPTGYGAGDPSVTGGDYNPEQPGPPRIPAHGQDWPVVLREPPSDAARLPLPALLSQVLAAFAIDYERERLGSLQAASNFLRFVGDDGVTLERAQALGGVSGNGKTLHERHLDVVVEPGKARDRTRRVHLTPKSRRARDAYPHLVMQIESRWAEAYGDAVPAMRAALSAMDPPLDERMPDYPSTTAWIHRLWFD